MNRSLIPLSHSTPKRLSRTKLVAPQVRSQSAFQKTLRRDPRVPEISSSYVTPLVSCLMPIVFHALRILLKRRLEVSARTILLTWGRVCLGGIEI